MSSVNDFYFENFTADYYLTRDESHTSHLAVTEAFTAVFPNYNQNHGFNRLIPFTFNNGLNSALPASGSLEFSVTRNGSPENINDITRGNGYFEFQIGDANRYVLGTQNYLLEYRFENVITNQSYTYTQDNSINDIYPPDNSITTSTVEYQELYWDALGGDSAQAVNSATVRLHLDAASQAAYNGHVACYVGAYGTQSLAATSRCTIGNTDDGFTFSTTDLSPNEAITFAVGFDADTFVVPTPQYNFGPLVAFLISLPIALASIGLVWHWLARGRAQRHAYRQLFVKPEFTTPRDLTVSDMSANYLGHHIVGKPMVATLLELAVTHKIELISTEDKKSPWRVRLKVSQQDLTDAQRDVLHLLARDSAPFVAGQEFTISKQHKYDATIAKFAEQFTSDNKHSLTTKQLRDSAVKSLSGRIWLATLGIPALLFLELVMLSSLVTSSYTGAVVGTEWLPAAFGALIIGTAIADGILIALFDKFQTVTDRGLEYSNYMEGLYLYISMAETDRLKFLQSVDGADVSHNGVIKLYEKLLPYASVFGLEKSWLKTMATYYEYDDVASPTWYLGAAILSSQSFNDAISSLTSAAGTSIAHSLPQDSSSSSGGSFGGGFSGGGGGGGGTSGW